MKSFLLSGFQPFDGRKENCSQLVCQHIANEKHLGAEINIMQLPVDFNSCWQKLKYAIDGDDFDFVIAMGEVKNREHVALERVAINLLDARIPDNSGFQPVDKSIDEKGSSAYFCELPIKQIYQNLAPNFKLEISLSAGSFVCNYLMYKLLQYSQERNFSAGFIHLPLCQEQEASRGNTSQDLAQIIKAIILELLDPDNAQ